MNILWELTVSAEFPKKFRTRKLGEIFYLMKNDIYFNNFFVLGDHYLDYEDWGEYRRAVSSYSVHPLYNVNAFCDFDIALLRLSTPANFSATVASIKLPSAPPQENQTCIATGRRCLAFFTLAF